MDIALRGVKYAAFASQETACFEATVYIDGKKAGTVSNEGHGGPHSFSPYQLETQLNAYGKTLSTVTTDLVLDGEPFTHEQDAESLINALLDDYLLERDLKKLLKKYILTLEGGKIMQMKPKHPPAVVLAKPANVQHLYEQMKAEKILNLLPFDEAMALYKKVA